MNDGPLVAFFRRLIGRPVAVLMLVAAVLGASAIAALRIPVELLPRGFASSTITVVANWPGANPVEVERRVGRPLEEELRTIRGLSEITTRAEEGSCRVSVSFPGSFDMDQAYAEVADRLERARPSLPAEVDRLLVFRTNLDSLPVVWCAVLYPDEMAAEAPALVEDVLVPRVEAVDGVASVRADGLMPRAVRILLDEDRVRANRIDIGQLYQRLLADNLSLAVGDLAEGGERTIIRVDGRFHDLAEIEDYPLGDGLRLRDVGRVEYTYYAPEFFFRINGRPSMVLAVSKETAANSFEVSRRLQELFAHDLPADPELGRLDYFVFYSEGETIANSLRDLVENAAIGGLIACAVLYLFLRRLRFTLLIALSIPFSVLATLAWLYFSGGSFNLFSMMGITISIGMLVDNSVVIVESIFQRRERGQPLAEACSRGPAEMVLAVVTATATTIVVFLPLIFMSEERNTRLFAASIGGPLCVALAAALILAILIVPVAGRFLVRGGVRPGPPRPAAPGWSGRLGAWLAGVVDWSLRHRFRACTLALLFLASAPLASSGRLVQERMGGSGQIEFDIDFSRNTTLAEAEAAAARIERAILDGGVLDRIREIGGAETSMGLFFGRRSGQIMFWPDRPLSLEEEQRLRDLVEQGVPADPAFEIDFAGRFEETGDRQDEWQRLVLSGPDSLTVAALAEEVRAAARRSGDWLAVAEVDDPALELRVRLDRDKLVRAGSGTRQVLGVIEWGLRGLMISRFQTPSGDVPLLMEFDEPEDPDRSRLAELAVAGFDRGTLLPLATFADFRVGRAPRQILRRDGRTLEVVGLKPRDGDLRRAAAAMERLMAGIDLPEGYRWEQEGGLRGFEEDLGELRAAFVLAVALVFLLMGLLFESILLPFSVLITIAFAVVGAFWTFRLTGLNLEIIGMIGMIVLAGVVVNNGIVLVDRIIRLRRDGLERHQAIVQSVRDRLRPVMMTAVTTIAGLLPIAIARPDGNSLSFRGLAVGVAGGLACATFFTLWAVPLLYSLFEDLGRVLVRETVGRLGGRRR
ncbi:MAG: efflux RND transporter permease subunit [Planctomycetota bacterium]|nr:MAG: efflux RND transporter permease subunit [Planctomycetota bacterium]